MIKSIAMLAPLIFVACATTVQASCPVPVAIAPSFAATGAELIVPQTWDVMAKGEHEAPCDAWREAQVNTGELSGFLPQTPTAVFDLSGLAPHILMVMAQSDCDAVLAVRSGDGQWFFGQDANARQEVTLWGVQDGPLQVWVGAQTPETCEATVTLETFDR